MTTEKTKIKTNIDMDALRNLVKSALSARRMTVQNLADETEIPKSTLDSFLNRGTTPAFDTVATVCASLDVSMDSISGVSAPNEPDGAPSVNEDRIADIKASHLREINTLIDNHRRETAALVENHARAMETMQQAHAAENAARDKHLEEISRDRTIWRIIAISAILLFILIFCVWFIWDISHPDAGLILYDKRSVIGPLGMG